MNPVDMSVVVATHNRAVRLRETLSDLGRQVTGGAFSYEVIVVDNNSSDGTKAAVESMRSDYPVRLRYLFEGRQGKPYALNLGLAAAAGPLLAFTDDDVAIEPTWLGVLFQAFQEYGADGVGGPVRPRWYGRRPSWIGDRLLRQLGSGDHGSEVFVVTSTDTRFVGANSAYRRALFESLGGFRLSHLRGQDSEWASRVFRAGYKLVYQPEAVVRHKIEAAGLTKRTIARRFVRLGRSRAIEFQERSAGRSICRMPLWVIRRFVTVHLEAFRCCLRGDHDGATWHWLERYIYLGVMFYCFRDWMLGKPTMRPVSASIRADDPKVMS